MKKPDIEDIFSALAGYATPPPTDLWDGIAAQLDEPKRKKRAIFWWPVAASLVFGLSLGGMFLFSGDDFLKNQPKIDAENSLVIEESSPLKDEEQLRDSTHIIQSNTTNAIVSTPSNRSTNEQKEQTQLQLPLTKTQNLVVNQPQKLHINHSSLLNPASKNSDLNGGNSTKNTNTSESEINPFAQNQLQNSTISNHKQLAVIDSVTQIKVANELQQLENLIAKTDDKEDDKEIKNQDNLQDKWSLGIYAGVANSENYSNKKVLGAAVSSKQSTGFGVKTNYKLNKK